MNDDDKHAAAIWIVTGVILLAGLLFAANYKP